ncbi:hypothetical protein SANTM175S_09398 [Streptomyces antimycoticus]
MTESATGRLPAGFDPVTLEVIRMRLDSIVEEMGIAMIRSSGSPVITECSSMSSTARAAAPCSTHASGSTPPPPADSTAVFEEGGVVA